jgi:hypothetical protein
MKKNFALMALVLVGATLLAHDNAFNPNFRQDRAGGCRASQGRSLKDILEQHGKPLETGTFVLTCDGLLTDDTPITQQIVKLQHRIMKLVILRDNKKIQQLMVLLEEKNIKNSYALIEYIQSDFGKEHEPLFAFVAAMVHDQNEINLIRTNALSLLSDPTCRIAVSEILRQLEEYQATLLILQRAFNNLWRLLVDAVTITAGTLGGD